MRKLIWFCFGILAAGPLWSIAQDWYEATGKPAQRSAVNSADLRTEFASIESDIAAKLPVLTGNGGQLIRVNAGGTALEAISTGLTVGAGGTGATTLTGLLQGNGTSAFTGIANSSTVGQILRTTGASTYAWGALDLADGDAITGDIPDANLSAPLTAIAGLAVTDSNIIVGNGTTWVAESGATARTSLGLAIGTNVQAFDAQLTDVAGLAVTDGNFIVGDGANFIAESGATARASLAAAGSATTISVSGTGLSGGGDLSANRTITIDQTAMTTRNISAKTGVAKTLSTSAPSGGADGDVWFVYIP